MYPTQGGSTSDQLKTATEAMKKREIPKAISHLEGALMELHERIMQLRSKLDPILDHETPQTVENGPELDAKSEKISDKIRLSARVVEKLISTVIEINGRVQL